ncbi:type VI secretion system baseplate subunit TssF [Simiduia sp. 21SJ11W-1]|uniref:type VI secretion system baseplate subunit TssF n=1 Tax=Simiduia sp. 21SJ11W-1 TaxID=2909669 RepID=UPI00209E4BA2|nr:type VI secretion system baseplate subunit TssF [Simiduia sp. 21SJ11W-1]UTA46625.1 type VI secretion system baseplate subunit TssF [Simiduia sp. 21SJ11W-1]
MSDDLLLQYERELAFINQSASEFAKKHPATASRLQLTGDTVEDPLVGKLLSGFAYLNARVQKKLNDDFPELTDAMLDTLYPHYLRPFPSCCIVQMEPAPELDKAHTIRPGTLLETESYQGESCKFTTAYKVELDPIKVSSASLMPRPFIAPGSNDVAGAGAVLKITLNTLDSEITFNELAKPDFRFFLKGLPQHVHPLYDLLLTKSIRIVLAASEVDAKPLFLQPGALRPIGFDAEDALLKNTKQGFNGYRLLTEYFAFPEKFQFLELGDLPTDRMTHYGGELNIYVYLSESDTELEHQVNSDMFALGCTPAINLFSHSADPIPLDHTEYAYHIIPDARRMELLEVYSVDGVKATDGSGASVAFKPFYGINHASGENSSAYWFTRRRPIVEGEHLNEEASEVDISLVNLNFSPYASQNQVLEVALTCSNRNLPKKLPVGGGKPLMALVDGSAPINRISCLVSPSATIRPPQKEGAYWRLISHLNLNHLSLTNNGGSPEALKEILRLYDFKNSASTRKIIESITRLKTQPMTAPIQVEDMVSLCRGTALHLELDPLMLRGVSSLVFATLLEHFFGLYCSINSFTRLKVSFSGQDREFKKWPPRAGEKTLL